MQRIFSTEGPWPTPWMDKILPVAAHLASCHPERTVFTRFIPPERPEDMRVATRECLDLQLLQLTPPLAMLCPPAMVIEKKLGRFVGEARLAQQLGTAHV
jgi:nicotinamidase-related amidase